MITGEGEARLTGEHKKWLGRQVRAYVSGSTAPEGAGYQKDQGVQANWQRDHEVCGPEALICMCATQEAAADSEDAGLTPGQTGCLEPATAVCVMGCWPVAVVGLQPLGLTGPEASSWAAQQSQASHWVDQLSKPSYWRNPHYTHLCISH